MKANTHTPWMARRIALIAATLALSACDAINDITADDDAYYHVSLGDSLSVGVQPDSNGILLPSSDGYADQLYDNIRPGFENNGTEPRDLDLVKFGCAGETLDSMISGGSCLYLAGSQLEAAVDFIEDNRDRIHLVTIDIGGNDFRNANCITTTVDLTCVNDVSLQIADDLAIVLADLNNAVGPNTTIVGMNYYNPYLGDWIIDAAGQILATESAGAATILNNFLSSTYTTAGVSMADVYGAYASGDFVTMVPSSLPAPNDVLPLAVANICTFTYMCDPDPVGPDIHANVAGYSLIAQTMMPLVP